jgi:hypothetical protein
MGVARSARAGDTCAKFWLGSGKERKGTIQKA